MIKFFRHIRKSLLAQNKMGKYFKYALGEIVLVVIGILIALQINNWNEERKNNTKEQQILSQLKEEYTTNLFQLEQKIAHRKKIIKAASKVLEFIDKPKKINTDSLISQLNILIGSPTFKPLENNLINSGNILLIKNEKLNQLLTTWPSEVLHVQEIEKIWNKRMWEYVIPVFSKVGILREGFYKWWNDENNLKWILEGNYANPFKKPNSSKSLTSEKILNNQNLEGEISAAVSVNYAANLQSNVLRKRILEILKLVKQEMIKK